jgi:nucleoside-diphosphate-sugar epimerase
LEYDSRENIKMNSNSPLRPVNLYTFYKSLTFLTLRFIFLKSQTNFIWLRPFFLYGGKEQNTRLVPTILNSIKKNKKVKIKFPNVVRDFIHVNKASLLIIKYLKQYDKKILVKNICSGKGMSIINFAKFIINDKNKYKYLYFKKNKK